MTTSSFTCALAGALLAAGGCQGLEPEPTSSGTSALVIGGGGGGSSAPCALAPGRSRADSQGADDAYFAIGDELAGAPALHVNPCSGNALLELAAGNHPLLTLTFNSADVASARDEGFGVGWRLAAGSAVQDGGAGAAVVVQGDGGRQVFERDATGSYRSPRGQRARLTAAADGLELRYPERLRYLYVGGRLARVVDRNDNVTVVEHGDPASPARVTAIVDTYGRRWTLAAIAGGSRITDPDGHQTDLVLTAGRLTQVRLPMIGTARPTVTIVYDGAGYPSRVTSPGGASRTLSFSTEGRLVTASDWRGVVTRADYFADATVIRDAYGDQHSLCFAQGAVASYRDPLGRVTAYARDPAGAVVGLREPSGASWQYAYDPTGALVGQTDPGGVTSTFTYDQAGNLATRADGLGHATSYGYDANDQLVTVSGPRPGDVESYARDPAGNLLAYRDAGGVLRMAARYDSHGNPIAITDELGTTTTLAYDVHGNLIERRQPGALGEQVTSYATTVLGDLLSVTTPDGLTQTFAYDGLRRVVRSDGPTGSAAQQLDLDGRLISDSATGPGGSTSSSFGYDLSGRLVTSGRNARPELVAATYQVPAPPAPADAPWCGIAAEVAP